MTEIKYENGVVVVSQYGVSTIRFRPCDLDFNSRKGLVGAVMDMPTPQESGDVGFLKTQPVEARQRALEEALGVSFPCITDYAEPSGACEICGYGFDVGDVIHEIDVAGEGMTVCDVCYHDVLRRG